MPHVSVKTVAGVAVTVELPSESTIADLKVKLAALRVRGSVWRERHLIPMNGHARASTVFDLCINPSDKSGSLRTAPDT